MHGYGYGSTLFAYQTCRVKLLMSNDSSDAQIFYSPRFSCLFQVVISQYNNHPLDIVLAHAEMMIGPHKSPNSQLDFKLFTTPKYKISNLLCFSSFIFTLEKSQTEFHIFFQSNGIFKCSKYHLYC